MLKPGKLTFFSLEPDVRRMGEEVFLQESLDHEMHLENNLGESLEFYILLTKLFKDIPGNWKSLFDLDVISHNIWKPVCLSSESDLKSVATGLQLWLANDITFLEVLFPELLV